MDQSLGTRLRLQRERQQVALAAIAAETKIKLSLLEALERDDVSHWPEGIFRRAYVRAYAQAIGLDPDEVVREFLELHPDSVEVLPAGAVAWPDHDSEAVSPASVTRFRRFVTSAMTAVPTLLQRTESSEPAPPPATSAHDSAVEEGAARPEISLAAAAQVCTRLARVQVQDIGDVARILEDTAGTLGAAGLIVWCWDSRAAALRPSLAHGYSEAVLAQLPAVPADAENAVAAAFRSGEPCIVNGGGGLTGALVVPLMGPSGCVGVLALEFPEGGEQGQSVRAFATIVAAQLVPLFGSAAWAGSTARRAAGAGA